MIDFGISPEQFVAEFYEQRYRFFKGALIGRPVAWKDINSTLFAWDPRDGLLQLFKGGKIPAEQYTENFVDLAMQRSRIVKDAFYAHLREGATLVLNRLETKSEPVNDLTMEVARFVGEKAVANGYAAFGGEGTFAKHWDTHDVFAVQLIGRKRWRVFEPTFPLPLPQQKSREHKHECPPEPVFDDILAAGDVLYIPRGWWHEAVPLPGEETFHIAVGIHPMLVRDYIAWSCFRTSQSDLALRQSIKIGGDDIDRVAQGAKAVEALSAHEVHIAEYKQEVLSSERVVSRFAIESLGRPGTPSSPIVAFRLNSAYRTMPRLSARVHVNGHAISLDEVSLAPMANLFSRPSVLFEDIARSHDLRAKAAVLLQQLTVMDIVSPLDAHTAPLATRTNDGQGDDLI